MHAADDVVLTAMGPGAEQFRGRIDNTRVFRAMATALGLRVGGRTRAALRRAAAVRSYALAYTPPPASPLAKFGAGILGYDCFEGVDVPQRTVPGIDPALLSLLTVAPRRFGFQATVVPPFSLHERRENELRLAVETLARDHHPMLLGPLHSLTPVHSSCCAQKGSRFNFRHSRPLAAPSLSRSVRLPQQSSSGDFEFQMKLAGPARA